MFKSSLRCLCASAAIAAVAFAAPVAVFAADSPATPPAATSGTGDLLSTKGLSKSGTLYVLAGEKEVIDGMRPLMQTKQKFDKDSKQREDLEKKSDFIKVRLSQADLIMRGYYQKIETVTDVAEHNKLVAQINILKSQMDEAKQVKGDIDARISALGDETREQYIQSVLDLSTKAQAVSDQYKDLSGDADVKAALAAAKGRLGPSETFTSTVNRLKLYHKGFSADVVMVKMDRGVPTIEVTVNGKITRTMIVDSGASLICLPADFAKDLDLIPGPNDPELIMQLADGKSHKAHQMTLKSVRVGPFTVENVDCAVLEPDLISAEPLLGGSFLKNFIYKLDMQAGELHLARTGEASGKTKLDMQGK